MNETKYIKIALMEVVRTNKKFDKKTKLELLEFIKTASKKDLDELKEGMAERKVGASIAGIIVPMILTGGILAPDWPIYRAIRAMFDKCTRRCGVFSINTGPRYACLLKCKIEGLTKLQSGISSINCAKSKNPDKCNQTKKDKGNEIKQKIQKVKTKYSEISKELKSLKTKERTPAKAGDMKWI